MAAWFYVPEFEHVVNPEAKNTQLYVVASGVRPEYGPILEESPIMIALLRAITLNLVGQSDPDCHCAACQADRILSRIDRRTR